MGQKGRTESVTAVLVALLTRRRWQQAELAREVELSTEAVRRILRELEASGLPLESEADAPHVYWKLPKTWYPGGVLFKQEDVPELLRQLRRLPKSKARDRLLAVVIEQLPTRARLAAEPPVVGRNSSAQEEQYVAVVEDAAARRVSLAMKYLTASRGKISDRHASVHLVDPGPPVRFIATCHRSGDLRWFRVDGIFQARADEGEAFRSCDVEKVQAFRGASLDGFKGEGAPVECSFFVREPEAGWVANNLLEGMQAESLHDGLRVRLRTSAVLRLARFVVGLGSAARAETPALAESVAELARGALAAVAVEPAAAESRGISPPSAQPPARLRSDV